MDNQSIFNCPPDFNIALNYAKSLRPLKTKGKDCKVIDDNSGKPIDAELFPMNCSIKDMDDFSIGVSLLFYIQYYYLFNLLFMLFVYGI